MPVQRQELENLGFHHSHDVFMRADMPDFRAINEPRADASIYVWVSPTAGVVNELDVLYVGKAGRGVSKRLREHRGGFVNSGTGRENRRLISEWIATGRSIMVFSRVAAVHEIFGVHVSAYSTEEQALCERFVPRWNRAVFPRAAFAHAVLPMEAMAQVPGHRAAYQPDFVPLFDQMAFGDEVAAFCNSLPPEKQAQFARLLDLLQQRDPTAGYKIVKGYTGQPSGYDGKPMLVFGKITAAGLAKDAIGRIPLVDDERSPLTITFKASSRAQGLDAGLFEEGRSGCWRPLDLSHFLRNIDSYLS